MPLRGASQARRTRALLDREASSTFWAPRSGFLRPRDLRGTGGGKTTLLNADRQKSVRRNTFVAIEDAPGCAWIIERRRHGRGARRPRRVRADVDALLAAACGCGRTGSILAKSAARGRFHSSAPSTADPAHHNGPRRQPGRRLDQIAPGADLRHRPRVGSGSNLCRRSSTSSCRSSARVGVGRSPTSCSCRSPAIAWPPDPAPGRAGPADKSALMFYLCSHVRRRPRSQQLSELSECAYHRPRLWRRGGTDRDAGAADRYSSCSTAASSLCAWPSRWVSSAPAAGDPAPGGGAGRPRRPRRTRPARYEPPEGRRPRDWLNAPGRDQARGRQPAAAAAHPRRVAADAAARPGADDLPTLRELLAQMTSASNPRRDTAPSIRTFEAGGPRARLATTLQSLRWRRRYDPSAPCFPPRFGLPLRATGPPHR